MPRQLAQRDRRLDRESSCGAPVTATIAHLRERHQQARDDAAEEQVADRGVGDERVDAPSGSTAG